MPPAPTWELLTGPVGALVLAIVFAASGAYATYRGWIVPGNIVRQMRDDWKVALKAQTDASQKQGEAIGKEVNRGLQKAVAAGVKDGIAGGHLAVNGKKARRRRKSSGG